MSIFVLNLVCDLHAEDSIVIAPTGANTQKKSLYLITDYLPAAIYEGDALTACFRVENTENADTSVEIIATTYDATDKSLAERKESVKGPAHSFAQCQISVDSKAGTHIRFVMKREQKVEGQTAIRMLRDDEVWPLVSNRNGHLETVDGQVLIPVVRKRLKTQDRAFVPIKWLIGHAAPIQKLVGKTVVFAPARWNLTSRPELMNLGPYLPNGTTPLCRALDQILMTASISSGKKEECIKCIIIFLPPEDLEVATDPHTYRIVLDALLAHLGSLAIKQIVLIPPFHFGVNERHRDMLWTEIKEASACYNASSLDPSDYLGEALWRADPEQPDVYGISPNSEGRKKIEQGLVDLLPK